MQVLGSRRGGLITLASPPWRSIAAVAFAVWQLIERPSVTEPLPGPGSSVSDARPRIAFSVPSDERLGDLRVLLDGTRRDVARPRRRRPGRPAARREAPSDGDHRWRSASPRATSSRGRSRASWTFTVDTTAPRPGGRDAGEGRARAPAPPRSSPARPSPARSSPSPPARSRPRRPRPTRTGAWRVVARLPEGRVARHRHGDRRRRQRHRRRRRGLTVDTTAPVLALSEPGGGRADHRDRRRRGVRRRPRTTTPAASRSPPP